MTNRREAIRKILDGMNTGDRFTLQMIIDRCSIDLTTRELGNLLKEFNVKKVVGHRRRGLNVWEVCE